MKAVRGYTDVLKHELHVYREQLEGGDRLAVLRAVNACARAGAPLPYWLQTAFAGAWSMFSSAEGPHSLDELFGIDSRPRGRAHQRDYAHGVKLWRATWDELSTGQHRGLGTAVSAARIAIKAPFAQTTALALVKRIDATQRRFVGSKYQTFSQFTAKRRKA